MVSCVWLLSTHFGCRLPTPIFLSLALFGFFTTQCAERPERQGEPSRFDTIPSQLSLHVLWNTNWLTLLILELEARRTDAFRLQTVIRLCRPLQCTALLALQPCACLTMCLMPISANGCDLHGTLEDRTELARPFERPPTFIRIWVSPAKVAINSERATAERLTGAWRPSRRGA
jgi:hypothetical protein